MCLRDHWKRVAKVGCGASIREPGLGVLISITLLILLIGRWGWN